MSIRLSGPSSENSGDTTQHDPVLRGAFTISDFAAWMIIIALGALPFFLYLRSPDFPSEDVAYFELAKSLLHSGFYGFNSVPERVQPPGFPAILAAICATFGCSYGILVRAMAVLLTMGLLSSYELIRREAGRGTAVAACFLLASAPQVFKAASQMLFPSYPYFLTSMLALLVIRGLLSARSQAAKYFLTFALSVLVASSILIQSAGLAIVGGLCGWLFVTLLQDYNLARSRFKLLLPVLVFGMAAQLLWMHRGSNPPDWPLPGYPGTYLSQLKLKSGNFPELGPAAPADFMARAAQNISDRVLYFVELFTRHWVSPSASSLFFAAPLVLILLGTFSSLAGETGYIAWYFIGYEFIYIFWPWSFELRFILPSLPLAFLFFCRGAADFGLYCRKFPRAVGTLCLPLSLLLTIHAARYQRISEGSYSLQKVLSLAFWFLSACFSLWLIWKNEPPFQVLLSTVSRILLKKYSFWQASLSTLQGAVALILAALVGVGLERELRIGRENLGYSAAKLYRVPDIRAALWVRDHTDPGVVIMARHIPLVVHYSDRKVIWFPPITKPQVLMEGVRRLHIQYVIVIDRDYSYYLPADEDCFDRLRLANPGVFDLMENGDQVRIYKVLPDSAHAVVR